MPINPAPIQMPVPFCLTVRAPLAMVLDVESIGLHGEGFAVAFAVCDTRTGQSLAEGLWACAPEAAQGSADDRAWVRQHVPDLPVNCQNPQQVRQRFWADWLHWRAQNAWLVADCAWPVESNFLSACVQDAPAQEAFLGPFPLIDVATCLALWPGPVPDFSVRQSDELPLHDPRADVRQSLRILHWLFKQTTRP